MPVVTILGPTVAAVLTGTFVIESLFAIPGMGKYYVESVQNNDYSLILGMTAFYGTFLVFCNMVVDILYGVIDPSADRWKVGGSMGEMKMKDGNVLPSENSGAAGTSET